MTAWHENARFRIFTDVDVFIEGSNYLLVENQAFNYHGDYVCCLFQQGRNLDGSAFYLQNEHCGADNEYIMQLEKAPWNIARDVIALSLENWKKREEEYEEDNSMEEEQGDILNSVYIQNAMDSLMHNAVEGEKYEYC